MKFFESLDVYYDFTPRRAALNMAVDEALFESATLASLRFYRWESPALSFGYFGRFGEAVNQGKGRDLVRRWTGGGIVSHGDDLTYSLVLPALNRSPAPFGREIYSALHLAIRDVLVETGTCATLAISASPSISNICFANPVVADVLIEGEKIAGAAQRRTRAGLLQQGSIQYPGLPHDFAERFTRELCDAARSRLLDDQIMRNAHDIAAQKYGTREWLERR